MQQKERLQEEKPRKRKGNKVRSQRKDRESVHLARQHEAYFDGGQKAAKGAYGVFISAEMMKDFRRVSKLKVLNNAGDGSFKLYYQADLEVLARDFTQTSLRFMKTIFFGARVNLRFTDFRFWPDFH
jgi:hypothetical protein